MVLLPYVLIPLVLSLLFNAKWKSITYAITFILIAAYPFCLTALKVHMAELMWNFFFIFNYLFLLPFALGLQYFFNKWILNKDEDEDR